MGVRAARVFVRLHVHSPVELLVYVLQLYGLGQQPEDMYYRGAVAVMAMIRITIILKRAYPIG